MRQRRRDEERVREQEKEREKNGIFITSRWELA